MTRPPISVPSTTMIMGSMRLDKASTAIVDRSYVVDEARGAVGVFGRIGTLEGRATSHVFRFANGAVRHHRESQAKQ